MNILPTNIRLCSLINSLKTNTYGIHLESANSQCLLQGVPKKDCDTSILKDLYDKNAYASMLLYFVENFDLFIKNIE